MNLLRPNNQTSRWMAHPETYRGMTAEHIRVELSLQDVPSRISEVHVPAGTLIRRGRVAANFGGNAGAVQYELLEPIPVTCFINEQAIDGVIP